MFLFRLNIMVDIKEKVITKAISRLILMIPYFLYLSQIFSPDSIRESSIFEQVVDECLNSELKSYGS